MPAFPSPAPACGAAPPAAAQRRCPVASPLLASAQSVSAPGGPLAALRELAESLARRAEGAGAVAVSTVPLPADGAVLLLSLWTSYAGLRAAVLDSGPEVRAWQVRTGLVPVSERALWWTRGPAPPEAAEGLARLARLRAAGPGAHAFTLRSPVPPPR